MSQPELSNFGSFRKTVIVFIVVLTAVLLFGIGAAAQLNIIETPELLNEEEELSTLQAVPSNANLILRYDVEQVENSNATRSIYGDNFSHSKFISTIRSNSSNISNQQNLSNLGEVIVFGTANINSLVMQNQYYGTLIETSESRESVATAVTGSTDYTDEEYKDYRILEMNNSSTSIGVLSEDEFYVIGNSEVVKDVIDTVRGEKDSVNTNKIPQTQGDVYANMAVYNFSGILGSISTDGIERIPQNIFVSQSTVNNSIRTQIDMKYAQQLEEKPESTTLPEAYRSQYKSNFTVNSTREAISISYTTSPRLSNGDLTGLATPDFTYSPESYR